MATITFDNIFDVVTEDKEKAYDLQFRSDLLIIIRDIINDLDSKHAGTERKLLIKQVALDFENLQIDKTSTRFLFRLLYRLGYEFRIAYECRRLKVSTESPLKQ